jgi:diguanylate cyclase (GGDEF)-like protein
MRHLTLLDPRRTTPPDDAALLTRGTDSLTGLLDRDTFGEVLERRTLGERSALVPFALLLLDLDRFAEVNNLHGPELGDSLLRAVAQRLRAEIRSSDVAARLSVDRFAVLMPDPSAESEANGMAARLLGVIQRPFVLEGRVLVMRCSIGIGLHPKDAVDQAGLLRCASQALREAKLLGSGGRRRLVSSGHEGLESCLAPIR